MGNFLKGLLGGFSGKVGNVVGSSWKGIDYMRSLPRKYLNDATEEQLMQRLKFACAVNFVKPMSALVSVGFKNLAKQKITGYNVAIQRIILKAITGEMPDYSVDYAKVQISEGSLPLAYNAHASSMEAGVVQIAWVNNSQEESGAHDDDNAIVLIYNPAKKRYLFNVRGEIRSAEHYDFSVPENFSNDDVHVYMAFITRDKRLVSNSEYLGTVTVF